MTPFPGSVLSEKKSKTLENADSKKLQNALKHSNFFDQCLGMIAIGSSGMCLVVAQKPLKAKYLSGDPQRLTMPDGIMIVRRIPPAYFDEFMGIPPEGVRLKKVRHGPAKFRSVRCNGSLQAGDWPGTLTSWDYRRYSWQDVRFLHHLTAPPSHA